MGVLLQVQELDTDLVGIDIIDPTRVKSRHRADQVEAVMKVPVRVEDFLSARSDGSLFDTVACISTLEHIGFDKATDPTNTKFVFARAESISELNEFRDPSTDSTFLDSAFEFLEPTGRLIISVPAGSGGPILHQDSLGSTHISLSTAPNNGVRYCLIRATRLNKSSFIAIAQRAAGRK